MEDVGRLVEVIEAKADELNSLLDRFIDDSGHWRDLGRYQTDAPVEGDQSPKKCSCCGIEFTPEKAFGDPFSAVEDGWAIESGWSLGFGSGSYIWFPCCSQPCADAINRMIASRRRWRSKERETIYKARRILKEARKIMRKESKRDARSGHLPPVSTSSRARH